MKKLLILSLVFGTAVIVVPTAEAIEAASPAMAESQVYVQPGRNRRWNRNRRTRTVVSTRIRWVGRYRYRETIRTTYFANGRTRTVVISRVRLSGRRVYRNY
jgi:hypothetical protein